MLLIISREHAGLDYVGDVIAIHASFTSGCLAALPCTSQAMEEFGKEVGAGWDRQRGIIYLRAPPRA